MIIRYIDDLTTTAWSGGTTTELAIWPPDAVYAGRNFLWRLSTAEVTSRESTFTALPDYERQLTIRRGQLGLRHDEGEWYFLQPGEIAAFDGGSRTRSVGRVTDFNLMLRKGRAQGRLDTARLKASPEFTPIRKLLPEWTPPERGGVRALFWSDGGLLHLRGDVRVILHPEELLLLEEGDTAEHLWLRTESDGLLIAAEMKQTDK